MTQERYLEIRKRLIRKIKKKQDTIQTLEKEESTENNRNQINKLMAYIKGQLNIIDIFDIEYEVTNSDTDTIWKEVINYV